MIYTAARHESDIFGECSNQVEVVVFLASTWCSNGKYQPQTLFDGEV